MPNWPTTIPRTRFNWPDWCGLSDEAADAQRDEFEKYLQACQHEWKQAQKKGGPRRNNMDEHATARIAKKARKYG